MAKLAHRIEHALSWFRPRPAIVRPPVPANENLSPEGLKTYLREAADQGGATYVPIGAKEWWLP